MELQLVEHARHWINSSYLAYTGKPYLLIFMKCFNITVLLLVITTSCSSGTLQGDDIPSTASERIKQLGLIDEDEKVLYFSTALDHYVSGNFITQNGIGSYWQYKDSRDNYKRFVLFDSIDSISIIYGDGFERTSALSLELVSGEAFNVHFNGNEDEFDIVFSGAINLWENSKR